MAESSVSVIRKFLAKDQVKTSILGIRDTIRISIKRERINIIASTLLKKLNFFNPVKSQLLYPYIYSNNAPPLGNCWRWPKPPSVGYHWIRLAPQAPKMYAALQISGPDQRGRRRRVPGGPEPGRRQGLIFWKSC